MPRRPYMPIDKDPVAQGLVSLLLEGSASCLPGSQLAHVQWSQPDGELQ